MTSRSLRQTVTFGAVGLASTASYFLLASLGAWLGLAAGPSSLLAYGICTPLSYFGHRWLTFASRSSVAETGARFLASTAAQLALATAIPWLLTDRFGLPPAASFAVVCVVIPIFSFLVMARFVFRPGASGAFPQKVPHV